MTSWNDKIQIPQHLNTTPPPSLVWGHFSRKSQDKKISTQYQSMRISICFKSSSVDYLQVKKKKLLRIVPFFRSVFALVCFINKKAMNNNNCSFLLACYSQKQQEKLSNYTSTINQKKGLGPSTRTWTPWVQMRAPKLCIFTICTIIYNYLMRWGDIF